MSQRHPLILLQLFPGTQKFEEAPAFTSTVLTPNKPWPVEVKSHAAQGETLTIPSFTMPQIAPGSSTPSASSNSSCSTVRKALTKCESGVFCVGPSIYAGDVFILAALSQCL